MKQISFFLTLWVTVLLLSACGGKNSTASGSAQGDTIPLHYSSNLSLIDYEDYIVAQLRNPWDTAKILHTYVLVDKNQPLPQELPQGTLVRTPLSKAIIYSSVHCSLLKDFGALNSIGGVCDLKYIKLPEIEEGCRNGTIADVGDGMNPNIEKIIDLHPDAILLSPFENSGGYGRVEKLNVPIIECADYMETSSLGRAEWIRFYGLLFGKKTEADAMFAAVERNYKDLQELVKPISFAPSVMCDLKTSSTWYTPGGNSTIAKLYSDAGANYIFREDTHSGSLPYPFEVIFEKGQQTDFWLIRYNQPVDKTYGELEKEFAPYAGFRPFKERNIYGCNTNRVPFYEETPFHPDWLLKDLIKIFHPSLLEGYELRYYNKLAE
ncbi:periplasmic binding protein [Bacteroides intestinalis CAG:315]|uniref:ABC transporter substrate-binding protein n=1 Tax=Bacteroides intestinalis TaxID=329854 RepID=A0A412YD50_9BACE|nr:ABC transporter substrate-binding protein [Bacteroides intestinalis]MCD7942600.1 ABC transporter substrate-binding protein [Bacteroides intestinalis]RGV55367.1 ABC transporter substrate-binding protein [Bacteroides intestinalis]RHA60492.1 ABC transporter substrate-binding protein [Bacteroides intestinalis]CDD90911.1 periplasmic binding protein [Bacteroides intestinalis CAG:315]